MSYAAFLAKKESRAQRVGIEVDPRELHAKLHDFQRAGVVWAAKAGRSALFWDCGLGKTFAQLEWARVSGDTVLLVAPLSAGFPLSAVIKSVRIRRKDQNAFDFL